MIYHSLNRRNVAKNATVVEGPLYDGAVIASLIRGKDTYGFSEGRPSDAWVAANLEKIQIISDWDCTGALPVHGQAGALS